jgi:hypothetical protein
MSEPRGRDQHRDDDDAGAPGRLALTPHEIEAAARALSQMDFGHEGLTRDELRARYPAMPKPVYLRLPSSKHFINALEVLQEAEIAPSRAEGEFIGAHPDLHEAEVIEEGGPPLWGPTPLFTPGGIMHGGSLEDTGEREEGE